MDAGNTRTECLAYANECSHVSLWIVLSLLSVPYGVLLSGGLDSSVIASIAAKVCATRIENDGASPAWWPSLHSFSVGLKDSPDLKAARIVADSLKTVHHEFHFTVDEGINAIRDVIYHLESRSHTDRRVCPTVDDTFSSFLFLVRLLLFLTESICFRVSVQLTMSPPSALRPRCT
jgi:hypothetical protein